MKTHFREIVQNSIELMIRKDMEGWPPDCTGWLYQPYRPEKVLMPNEDLQNTTSHPVK